MRYLSTRSQLAKTAPHFCDILLEGLSPDGGLFLPETYPQLSKETLDGWRTLSYADLAFEILSLFIDDIPKDDLKTLLAKTYRADVFCHARDPKKASDITPLYPLENNLFLQELSNGPTLAFKDMAMQFLGNAFEYVLKREQKTLNILGATSGDTGSAAEYAMRGKEGISVFMLSPHDKMSAFQRAQMYSLQDKNIVNLAVRGMFDDAQDIVKAVSSDADFKARHKIGAVNSINWARVLAQVVYYVKGYLAATSTSDEQVDFAVPSGNFGNICAGHIARQMGLPIRHLILATNENNVLDEFFKTGRYRPRTSSETFVTSSPSMDISKASNFERFVFDLIGRDPKALAAFWQKVEAGEGFDLKDTSYFERLSHFGFLSGKSTHQERLATIADVYKTYGVFIDTHTADAVKVATAYRDARYPMIIMETAQAAKFEETIIEAIGKKPPRPKEMANIEALPQRVRVINPDVREVKAIIEEAQSLK